MRRPEKLAELIREEISQIVGFELEDPRVASVTVTDVRVTDNLRDARVFVLPEGTEAERVAALKALHHAAPYVRRQLGMVLNLKYTPEIHFIRDTVEEAAARVDDLLTQIAQEEKSQLSPEDTAGDPREETPQTRNDER
jgi:ribosome-binding factor A